MKINDQAMARRVGQVLRDRVSNLAQILRGRLPHVHIIALGDQLRLSLRRSAKSRAAVMRALRRHYKP